MKRIISLSICILMIFNFFAPQVFAASSESDKLEKVLVDIKTRIPDTSVFSEFDSGIRNENGKTIYSFNWDDSSNKSMYVSALESGVIIEYGFYEEIRNQQPVSGFDRISPEEAVRRTQVLINKLNPSIAGKLFVNTYDGPESFNSDKLYFDVIHKEGGVPVQNDIGRVTVDINAEKISSFRMTYTEGLKYVSPHNIISQEAAQKAFAKELGLTLSYRIYKDYENRTVKAFSAYTDENGTMYLDANTGKATEIQLYYDLFYSKNETMSDSNTGGSGGGLSAAEANELENISAIITATDAERLVRGNSLLGVTGDYVLEESGLRKNVYQENSYIRTMVFRSTGNNKAGFIHLEIDAADGGILSYSNFSDKTSTKKLSDGELKTASEELFEKLALQKHSEYRLNADNDDSNGFFTYTRYVNGIPVTGDTASIELSTSDARLVSYRINYTETSFPKVDKVIDHDTACGKFFEHTTYTPLYIPQKSDESLKNTDTTTLVFATGGENIILDANTGNRITSSGAEYKKADVFEEYTDIEGHYAEDKIRALHRFGIGFDGSLFKPDQPISQSEFLNFANKGFLQNLSVSDLRTPPENILTRIEATRLICRVLDIDRYAEIEDIYNCPFTDVQAGKGYASLLWGLGIINGTSKDRFSPNDGLTRAQAAIIIYNTMNKAL